MRFAPLQSAAGRSCDDRLPADRDKTPHLSRGAGIHSGTRRINEIVHGKRAITADTALRLSRALGLSDMFFINMQARYEAEIARGKLAVELGTIERIA